MKKYFVFLLFISSINFVSSQVSGYMGKRFSIFYSASLGIPHSFSNIPVGGYSQRSNSGLKFPINHALKLDFICSHKLSFGLKYKFANTNIPNIYKFSDAKNLSITSHTYGFVLKFHRFKFYNLGVNELLPPLGFYFHVGLGFQQLHLKNIVKDESNRIYTYRNRNSYAVVPSFGVGRNFLLADFLLLGFELEIGAPMPSVPNRTSDLASNFNYYNEIFKLSLNFGILPF